MKGIDKSIMENRMKSPLVLLALLAAMAPGADAKHRAATPPEQPATVVAHVPLEGSPTNQINLQENGGKQYLYIGAHSNQGVTVVDVTNPGQPNVIRRVRVAESSFERQIAIGQRRACSRRRRGQRLDGSRTCAFDEDGKRTRLE